MKYLFLLSFIISCSFLYSYEVEWAKMYKGPNNKPGLGNDIFFHNNTLYTTGSCGSESSDLWLLGADIDGNVILNQNIGGTGNDVGHSLIVDNDNIYAVGESGNNGYFVKTDLSGSTPMELNIEGLGENGLNHLLKMIDGNLLLSGFDTKNGSKDFFIYKINPDNGKKIWSSTLGNHTKFEKSYSSIVGPNYHIFIVGYTSHSKHALVVKTNYLGVYEADYKHSQFESFNDIIYDDNNKFILLGYSKSFASGSREKLVKAKIVKMDTDGNFLESPSTFTFGNNNINKPKSIIKLSSGNYLLCGLTKVTEDSNAQAWLCEFTPLGDVVWNYAYDENIDDEFNSVIELPDQSLVAVGKTISNDNHSKQLIVKFRKEGINQAPVVSEIPSQTVDEGQQFSTINLDDYVADPDNDDEEIIWSIAGNNTLSIDIIDRVATISYPNTWFGSETITFTATDPKGLFHSGSATFTVNDIDQPISVTSILPNEGGNLTVNEGDSLD
ncbi:MAG: hypothetical protein CR982_00680, partial [Candidatus Cloacimonadota bacterium]